MITLNGQITETSGTNREIKCPSTDILIICILQVVNGDEFAPLVEEFQIIYRGSRGDGGMNCFVNANNTLFKLEGKDSTWSGINRYKFADLEVDGSTCFSPSIQGIGPDIQGTSTIGTH